VCIRVAFAFIHRCQIVGRFDAYRIELGSERGGRGSAGQGAWRRFVDQTLATVQEKVAVFVTGVSAGGRSGASCESARSVTESVIQRALSACRDSQCQCE
jgi:hypothetical protein